MKPKTRRTAPKAMPPHKPGCICDAPPGHPLTGKFTAGATVLSSECPVHGEAANPKAWWRA